MKSNDANDGSREMLVTPSRAKWEKPELFRIDVSDAEAGPNPIAPEGAFAQGS
jgi:hypothetical protein